MNNLDPKMIDFLERCESYHDDRMNDAEKASFEKEIKLDQGLNKLYHQHIDTIIAIKKNALAKKLDDFHVDRAPSKKTNLKFYAIAAVGILLIGFLAGQFFFKSEWNEQLFADYYEPDPGLITTMSTTDNYEFNEGMVYYKMGEYDKAIANWSALKNADNSSDTLYYFLGVAYLATDQTHLSTQFLNTAKKYPNSAFTPEIQFYLGLSHLKDGDIDLAKNAFKSSNDKRAVQLLKKLNEKDL